MFRARRWTFTQNERGVTNANDPRGDRVRVFEEYIASSCAVVRDDVGVGNEIVDYIGGQLEENKNGGLHWQGIIHTRQPVSMQRVLDWFAPAHPHLERMRGSWAQAKAYCQKVDSRVLPYTDAGVEPDQGARNDLADLYQRLRLGESKEEVADAFPGQYIRYHGAFAAVQGLAAGRDLDELTNGIFIFGPPGVGKSRLARDLVRPNLGLTFWYPNIPTTWWFDGLQPHHQFALFDDTDSSLLPVRTLLRLLDRGPMRVNVKGSTVQWNVKTAIFTSNDDLETTFPYGHPAAIERRFAVILKIDAHGRYNFLKGDDATMRRLMRI